ncbi:MAG: hypothetical protein PUI16_02145 [Clostridia bacterium]|nr:hypothetical protein [Clostridia bacterium]MDY5554770.1 hypothetical protein [Blautia sp.]
MKKIYSKFTRERDVKFQIETSVYEDENKQLFVGKTPLNEQGLSHVLRMHENYQYFKNNNINFLLPCEIRDQAVIFPYASGKSVYEKLLDSAHDGDRNQVLKIFQEYLHIFEQMYPDRHPFRQSEDFTEIFGNAEFDKGIMASSKINIDLTFDNIIYTEEGIRILDYEWIFDFDLPVKFPVYRAIYALFIKHRQIISKVISDEELYEMADISKEERNLFECMNRKFMEYVEGYDRSYTRLLGAYVRPEETNEAGPDYAQIFWSDRDQFSESRMKSQEISIHNNVNLEINPEEFEETRYIRIDPSNNASIIRILRFEAETDSEIWNLSEDEYDVNGMKIPGNYLIFTKEDPQIIIPVQREKNWKKIRFEYVIEYSGFEDIRDLFDMLDSYCKSRIGKLQDKVQEQSDQLSQCAEIIHLQQDKLSYIEGTKVYRALLKNKVDSIHVWDQLKDLNK